MWNYVILEPELGGCHTEWPLYRGFTVYSVHGTDLILKLFVRNNLFWIHSSCVDLEQGKAPRSRATFYQEIVINIKSDYHD